MVIFIKEKKKKKKKKALYGQFIRIVAKLGLGFITQFSFFFHNLGMLALLEY